MAKIGRDKARKEGAQAGGQGRVKDPRQDKRFAANRGFVSTGQGAIKREDDKRLACNRNGSTGQGQVKNPGHDRRLSVNRNGVHSGQGIAKDPTTDKRRRENRAP